MEEDRQGHHCDYKDVKSTKPALLCYITFFLSGKR